MKQTTINIREARSRPADEPLHVINSFVNAQSNMGGEIYLNIRQGFNDIRTVRIPATWVPYEIIGVDRMDLLKSFEFQTAVEKNALQIASPDYVNSLESNELAQAEYARVRKLEAGRNDPRALEEFLLTPPRRTLIDSSGVDKFAKDTETEIDVREQMLRNDSPAPVYGEETDEVANDPRAVNNRFKAWAHALNDFVEVEARARILGFGVMSAAQVAHLAQTIIHEDLRVKLETALKRKKQ